MEVRLYAEDPDNISFLHRKNSFSPRSQRPGHSPGRWRLRADVPNDYDPLLSKLIAGQQPRGNHCPPSSRARGVHQPPASRPTLASSSVSSREPDFLRGEIHTKWLDELLAVRARLRSLANENQPGDPASDAAAIRAAIGKPPVEQTSSPSASSTDQPSRWKQEGRREQLDRLP